VAEQLRLRSRGRAGRPIRPVAPCGGRTPTGSLRFLYWSVTLWRFLAFWTVLGASAVASVPLWPRLLRHAAPHTGPALVLAACGLGALLPALSASLPAALASAVAFGGSFLAVVAAVSNSARTLVPPGAVTAAVGTLTVAFALGQSLGPVLAGVIADAPAGLRASLALSALALLTSAGVLARVDERRARQELT